MEDVVKIKHMFRITEEQLSERVLLKKTEQVCRKKNAHTLYNMVLVEKYIDNQLVNSYSWNQSLDEDEYNEFLILAEENKKNYKPKRQRRPPGYDREKSDDRKEYRRQYYLLHKEEIKKYNEKRKDELKEYKKQYYKENRERILTNIKLRQKQLWEEKQKNNNS